MSYIDVDDVRAEDVTEDELSDDRCEALIAGWEEWFNKRTGQWFEEKELTLFLDGNDSRVLWLDIPIVEIDELYINNDFDNVVDDSCYVVYNRYYPDDRKNPRIKLTRTSTTSIYSITGGTRFVTGDQNQKIVGSFGYVEEDGSVPFAVKRAIVQFVILTAQQLNDGEIDLLRAGRVIEEVTDRHRIRYADVWNSLTTLRPTGFEEIDNALTMYRRPMRINAPRFM